MDQRVAPVITLVALVIAFLVDLLPLLSLVKKRDISFDSQYIISFTLGELLFSFMKIVVGMVMVCTYYLMSFQAISKGPWKGR